MDRFILRFRGPGPLPEELVRRVEEHDQTRILEQTPRMLLVEGTEEAINSIVGDRTDFLVAKERSYTRPDTGVRVKR